MAINGVERIAERILRDAQTEAAGIKKVADENCAVIDAQYEKQAKDAAASILEAAEKEAGEVIKRMKGEADMRARSALLEEKQALMQKAFEAAQQELLNMDEEKYRAFLVKLACRASVSGKEQLALNAKDLARFGQALCDDVNKALAESGKTAQLTLCAEPAGIDGGCKLRSGSVETNCSIGTLIDTQKDALVPQVAALLFG
ncbi:MAG: V-type ATP synthase subunit E [Firmicutes bacterium]|nr:V-type ATP synthase subunit E [Bacillota bacterium]